jgi:hypothetical protein
MVVPVKLTEASRVTVTPALMIIVQLLQTLDGGGLGAQVRGLLQLPELTATMGWASPRFTKPRKTRDVSR